MAIDISFQMIYADLEEVFLVTVIKKSGKHEEFSAEKMLASIRAANMGTEEYVDPLLLLAEFKQIVEGKELISTQHIDVIIYGLLYSKGYLKTLLKYIEYDKR